MTTIAAGVLALLLLAQPKPGMLVWQHESLSQKDIDTYVWRYYLNGAKRGVVMKGVVCKQTELPTFFTCWVAVPKVVGQIRITATHPKLGESPKSGPISIPPGRR